MPDPRQAGARTHPHSSAIPVILRATISVPGAHSQQQRWEDAAFKRRSVEDQWL
jgi:hypothetical protein